MSNLNDDYWNSSSTSKFNFDDEDLSTCEIDSVANDVFSSKREKTNILDIHFIISEKCLDMLLADTETQIVHAVPPVDKTVKKMMYGESYILEVYKSYEHKVLLLDEALKSQSGDIICRVTEFLRKTLKYNIFCNIMFKRKVALIQYSNFIKMQGNIEELENFYMATGFTKNISDLYFLNKRNGTNKQETLNRLKCFITGHSQYLTANEKKFLLEYIRFLEWQIINKEDSDSIIDQLAVVCNKQWLDNPNNDRPADEFKKIFKVDDSQFEWTVINCLAFLGLWKKLIGMFVKPNWLTKKNMLRSAVQGEHFFYGVSRHNPPKNVLEQLLTCLDNSEESLELAEKFQCYKFMIAYYINQKDREGLLRCMNKVTLNSEEYYMITKALESQDKKWKN